MGGEIGFESEEGTGSEFWFTVTFKQDQSAHPVLPDSGEATLRDQHVLIVDDNATNRKILREQLQAWGVRVDEATSGAEALKRLHEALEKDDPFCLAILDMQMPEMDGRTLGAEIRRDSTHTATRLVMMTSIGMQGEAPNLRREGFSLVLNKPVRQSQLLDELTRVLAEQEAGWSSQKSKAAPEPFTFDRKFRILLVEDNPTNQHVLVGILRNFALYVETAGNGKEAIHALESFPYDLVLMDVQMPEMDGLTATRRIRSSNTNVLDRRIPIIALTAHAMQGDREKCLEAGMNDYLSKPVMPASLGRMLQKWLRQVSRGTSLPPSEDFSDSAIDGDAEGGEARREKSPKRVWDRDRMLEFLMHNEALTVKVTRQFLDQTPNQIRELAAAIEEGDRIRAEQIAHSIKGAAANLGAEVLRECAFSMEMAAKSADFDALQEAIGPLQDAFKELCQEMAAATE